MKKSVLSSTLLFLCTSFVLGQTLDYNPKKKRLRITEAYIYPSVGLQRVPLGTLNDFRKLAAQSTILNKDLSAYSSAIFMSTYGQTAFSAKLGISFVDKDKNTYRANPTLRMGFNYFRNVGLISQLNKTTRVRFDTLYSTTGGPPIYLDSVTRYFIGMSYGTEELRVDVSLVFRTDIEARWSMYGGMGITLGGSLNSYTDINYNESSSVESSATGYSMNTNFYSSSSERFKNKSSIGYSMYLPLGLDFRMGNKREFWKRLHMYYEAKPYLNISYLQQIGMFTNVGIQNGLGLRVTF